MLQEGMKKAMKNENKFYNILEDIFVGSKIEGEGGFVNLLKIKEKYYSKIIEQLKKEIKEDKQITADFKEEFYDKLYSFFEKYFNECGKKYMREYIHQTMTYAYFGKQTCYTM